MPTTSSGRYVRVTSSLQGGVPMSHLVLEGILIASVVYLFFFTKTYRPKKTEKLTKAVRHQFHRLILARRSQLSHFAFALLRRKRN